MNLAEALDLTAKAGVATIQFRPGDNIPFRDGDTIHLPMGSKPDSAQLYWLADKTQFLFAYRQGYGGLSGVWFGGTDESPFLVQLDDAAMTAFKQDGEVAFFAAIRPDVVKELEQAGGAKLTARQGDIFACPVADDWWQLQQELWQGGSHLELDHGAWQVFNTRHQLTGRRLFARRVLPASQPTSRPTIVEQWYGEGRLEAPDHLPLELRGPHLLAQTALLHHSVDRRTMD